MKPHLDLLYQEADLGQKAVVSLSLLLDNVDSTTNPKNLGQKVLH